MEEIKKVIVKARHNRQINWLLAQKSLRDCLDMNPRSVELARELADLYYWNKKYRGAIAVCREALGYNEDETLTFIMANSFICIHDYTVALRYFNKLNHETPEILYNKAISYSRLGRADEAIHCAEKLIGYNLKTAVPYVLMAEMYLLRKDYKKVISSCRTAQSIAGLSGEICFLMGMAWLAQKNLLKAYWEFHLGEAFNYENPDYYRSYGIVCEGIGKTDKAIELLRRAISINPRRPEPYLELISIYLVNDRYELAHGLLLQAKKDLPDSFSVNILYSQMLDKLRNNTSGSLVIPWEAE
jgi:tetratricopeptide (TPR) repeat protein